MSSSELQLGSGGSGGEAQEGAMDAQEDRAQEGFLEQKKTQAQEVYMGEQKIESEAQKAKDQESCLESQKMDAGESSSDAQKPPAQEDSKTAQKVEDQKSPSDAHKAQDQQQTNSGAQQALVQEGSEETQLPPAQEVALDEQKTSSEGSETASSVSQKPLAQESLPEAENTGETSTETSGPRRSGRPVKKKKYLGEQEDDMEDGEDDPPPRSRSRRAAQTDRARKSETSGEQGSSETTAPSASDRPHRKCAKGINYVAPEEPLDDVYDSEDEEKKVPRNTRRREGRGRGRPSKKQNSDPGQNPEEVAAPVSAQPSTSSAVDGEHTPESDHEDPMEGPPPVSTEPSTSSAMEPRVPQNEKAGRGQRSGRKRKDDGEGDHPNQTPQKARRCRSTTNKKKKEGEEENVEDMDVDTEREDQGEQAKKTPKRKSRGVGPRQKRKKAEGENAVDAGEENGPSSSAAPPQLDKTFFVYMPRAFAQTILLDKLKTLFFNLQRYKIRPLMEKTERDEAWIKDAAGFANRVRIRFGFAHLFEACYALMLSPWGLDEETKKKILEEKKKQEKKEEKEKRSRVPKSKKQLTPPVVDLPGIPAELQENLWTFPATHHLLDIGKVQKDDEWILKGARLFILIMVQFAKDVEDVEEFGMVFLSKMIEFDVEVAKKIIESARLMLTSNKIDQCQSIVEEVSEDDQVPMHQMVADKLLVEIDKNTPSTSAAPPSRPEPPHSAGSLGESTGPSTSTDASGSSSPHHPGQNLPSSSSAPASQDQTTTASQTNPNTDWLKLLETFRASRVQEFPWVKEFLEYPNPFPHQVVLNLEELVELGKVKPRNKPQGKGEEKEEERGVDRREVDEPAQEQLEGEEEVVQLLDAAQEDELPDQVDSGHSEDVEPTVRQWNNVYHVNGLQEEGGRLGQEASEVEEGPAPGPRRKVTRVRRRRAPRRNQGTTRRQQRVVAQVASEDQEEDQNAVQQHQEMAEQDVRVQPEPEEPQQMDIADEVEAKKVEAAEIQKLVVYLKDGTAQFDIQGDQDDQAIGDAMEGIQGQVEEEPEDPQGVVDHAVGGKADDHMEVEDHHLGDADGFQLPTTSENAHSDQIVPEVLVGENSNSNTSNVGVPQPESMGDASASSVPGKVFEKETSNIEQLESDFFRIPMDSSKWDPQTIALIQSLGALVQNLGPSSTADIGMSKDDDAKSQSSDMSTEEDDPMDNEQEGPSVPKKAPASQHSSETGSSSPIPTSSMSSNDSDVLPAPNTVQAEKSREKLSNHAETSMDTDGPLADDQVGQNELPTAPTLLNIDMDQLIDVPRSIGTEKASEEASNPEETPMDTDGPLADDHVGQNEPAVEIPNVTEEPAVQENDHSFQAVSKTGSSSSQNDTKAETSNVDQETVSTPVEMAKKSDEAEKIKSSMDMPAEEGQSMNDKPEEPIETPMEVDDQVVQKQMPVETPKMIQSTVATDLDGSLVTNSTTCDIHTDQQKKSPQEMIDELSAKVVEEKALIPKIEEAAKNEHLPADDKPKAEQLVSNLEAFIKDVETQVSEKQDELDKLNNANDAIRRLGDALDDAEKTVVSSNVTALNEFKDRIAPHLATLVEAVKEVPVSVEPSAAALRDRAAKFVSDLEKNIQKTGDDEKRAEELKNDVGNAVKNVDDVVSKYQNQTTQPLNVAKEDANKLKTAVEQLNKLAKSCDKIDPQVAKDIKDSKTKAKELLLALEKAIPQEDAIRREQAEINDRLNNLEKELAKVDELEPEDALPLVDQLATDTTSLKAVTDSNNEKAVAPSSLISHDDLVVGLPEKVFQLQHAIDDKKQALNKAAAINDIAQKLQLVSQQLQSVPQEVPASLDKQKQLLEDVENQKHDLENLLVNLPENDPAADELRQKSQWDLSRLKDLLKQLGSAVEDKLAALAAFNAARKNVEDALLDITREDGTDHDKTPDELIDDLPKKEETVAKLRETVAGVKPDELDEKERAEYNDLLARLATAADVLKNKRAKLEQAIKAKTEEKSLHDAVDRIVSRLVPLVRDAEELRHNAEAVPTQYAPKAEELKKEVEAAKAIIANAPASDDHVQQLQQVVATAETLIPTLEERARLWDEFLVARNDIDALIKRLQQPLDAVVAKPKRSAEEAAQDVENLRQSAQQLPDLDNKISNLQRNSKLLDPLESAYADVRFFVVDAEQTRHQYDDVLNDVAAELEDEKLLKQSANQVAKEIDDISKMIDSTDPERSILDTIAKSDVPALKAQINRIKDRIVNADASRKHVTTDPKIADDLDNKLVKLEAELDDAIKTSDEHDKEIFSETDSMRADVRENQLIPGTLDNTAQISPEIVTSRIEAMVPMSDNNSSTGSEKIHEQPRVNNNDYQIEDEEGIQKSNSSKPIVSEQLDGKLHNQSMNPDADKMDTSNSEESSDEDSDEYMETDDEAPTAEQMNKALCTSKTTEQPVEGTSKLEAHPEVQQPGLICPETSSMPTAAHQNQLIPGTLEDTAQIPPIAESMVPASTEKDLHDQTHANDQDLQMEDENNVQDLTPSKSTPREKPDEGSRKLSSVSETSKEDGSQPRSEESVKINHDHQDSLNHGEQLLDTTNKPAGPLEDTVKEIIEDVPNDVANNAKMDTPSPKMPAKRDEPMSDEQDEAGVPDASHLPLETVPSSQSPPRSSSSSPTPSTSSKSPSSRAVHDVSSSAGFSSPKSSSELNSIDSTVTDQGDLESLNRDDLEPGPDDVLQSSSQPNSASSQSPPRSSSSPSTPSMSNESSSSRTVHDVSSSADSSSLKSSSEMNSIDSTVTDQGDLESLSHDDLEPGPDGVLQSSSQPNSASSQSPPRSSSSSPTPSTSSKSPSSRTVHDVSSSAGFSSPKSSSELNSIDSIVTDQGDLESLSHDDLEPGPDGVLQSSSLPNSASASEESTEAVQDTPGDNPPATIEAPKSPKLNHARNIESDVHMARSPQPTFMHHRSVHSEASMVKMATLRRQIGYSPNEPSTSTQSTSTRYPSYHGPASSRAQSTSSTAVQEKSRNWSSYDVLPDEPSTSTQSTSTAYPSYNGPSTSTEEQWDAPRGPSILAPLFERAVVDHPTPYRRTKDEKEYNETANNKFGHLLSEEEEDDDSDGSVDSNVDNGNRTPSLDNQPSTSLQGSETNGTQGAPSMTPQQTEEAMINKLLAEEFLPLQACHGIDDNVFAAMLHRLRQKIEDDKLLSHFRNALPSDETMARIKESLQDPTTPPNLLEQLQRAKRSRYFILRLLVIWRMQSPNNPSVQGIYPIVPTPPSPPGPSVQPVQYVVQGNEAQERAARAATAEERRRANSRRLEQEAVAAAQKTERQCVAEEAKQHNAAQLAQAAQKPRKKRATRDGKRQKTAQVAQEQSVAPQTNHQPIPMSGTFFIEQQIAHAERQAQQENRFARHEFDERMQEILRPEHDRRQQQAALNDTLPPAQSNQDSLESSQVPAQAPPTAALGPTQNVHLSEQAALELAQQLNKQDPSTWPPGVLRVFQYLALQRQQHAQQEQVNLQIPHAQIQPQQAPVPPTDPHVPLAHVQAQQAPAPVPHGYSQAPPADLRATLPQIPAQQILAPVPQSPAQNPPADLYAPSTQISTHRAQFHTPQDHSQIPPTDPHVPLAYVQAQQAPDPVSQGPSQVHPAHLHVPSAQIPAQQIPAPVLQGPAQIPPAHLHVPLAQNPAQQAQFHAPQVHQQRPTPPVQLPPTLPQNSWTQDQYHQARQNNQTRGQQAYPQAPPAYQPAHAPPQVPVHPVPLPPQPPVNDDIQFIRQVLPPQHQAPQPQPPFGFPPLTVHQYQAMIAQGQFQAQHPGHHAHLPILPQHQGYPVQMPMMQMGMPQFPPGQIPLLQMPQDPRTLRAARELFNIPQHMPVTPDHVQGFQRHIQQHRQQGQRSGQKRRMNGYNGHQQPPPKR